MRVICISIYSLASSTRFDVVELIERKYFVLYGDLFVFWKLHFTIQSDFKIKISSNALTKLRLKNFWKLRTAILNRPMRLQFIICHKKELHKTIKETTRVPEISQLRAGNHSDSNGKGESNVDQQACR